MSARKTAAPARLTPDVIDRVLASAGETVREVREQLKPVTAMPASSRGLVLR